MENNQIAELRQTAKDLGIRNWHNKTMDKLQIEVLEAQEKATTPTDELAPKVETTKPTTFNPDITTHEHHFTDPTTGKIGKYILTDARNTIPVGKKGTAYQFVQWM